MSQSPGLLITIVGFLLMLGPLVFIHELGHYLVGRWCGVRADVFSIGFGKELAGWTDKRGTRWKLSMLPLGGYVQFAGDMNPASQPSPEWLALPADERAQTFQGKPLWQRASIVAAGPLTNFLFAILILAGFNYGYGEIQAPPVIGEVQEGSAAARGGLREGDRIVTLRGSEIDSFRDIQFAVGPHPGEPLPMVIDRGGDRITLDLVAGERVDTDKWGNSQKVGYLGVSPSSVEIVKVGPIRAVTDAVGQTRDIVEMMVTGLVQIATGKREVKQLGGPIAMAKLSGEQLATSWQSYVWFVALISINLGFINLLPIPVLDGGHLAFYAAEAVRRKPVSAKGQEWAFRTGLALVLALMLFVTVNDFVSLKLFGG